MKLIKMAVSGLLALLMGIMLSGCAAPAAPGGGTQGFDWTIVIFLVLIIAVFYFLTIRPQRKRQKEHQTMMEALKTGDEVITIGGIYGRIEQMNDENVVLKVESGTIRVARNAVAGKRIKQ